MTNEELVRLIQSGERDKLNQLWEQVERFVGQQANRRMVLAAGFGGVTFGDLYNSGYLALVEAAATFQADRGLSFLGWFALYLRTAFADAGGYRSARQSKDPLHRAGSLDVPLGDGDDGTLVDTIADPSDPMGDAELSIWREQLNKVLAGALDSLPEEQRETLEGRYYSGYTLAQVAQVQGVPPERVRRWEDKALKTLRRCRYTRQLRQFLDDQTPWYYRVSRKRFSTTYTSAVEALAIYREQRLEYLKKSTEG